MGEKEIEDLSRYFRLIHYRDQDDMYFEELEELGEIVKRNPLAKQMEDEYYQFLQGKITEEEYHQKLEGHQKNVQKEIAIRQAKKIVTTSKRYIDCDGVIVDTERGLFDDYYLMKERNPNLHKREYLQNLDWRYWLRQAPVIGDSINILKSYDPKSADILTTVHSLQEAEAKIDYFRGKKVSNNIIFVPAGIPKSQVVIPLNSLLVDNDDNHLKSWDYNFGISFSCGNPESSFEKIDSLDEVLNSKKLEKRLVRIFEKKY